MEIYNNNYLEYIDSLLDHSMSDYSALFAFVFATAAPKKFEKVDIDALIIALQKCKDTELSATLSNLLDVSTGKFRYELVRNLSSFSRDNQEKYYRSLLIDFMYRVGISVGAISIHEETVLKVEKVFKKYNLFRLHRDLFADYSYKVDCISSMLREIAEVIEVTLLADETKPVIEDDDESASTDQPKKDRYAMKDQILLLNEMGIFDLPQIKNLTSENRGKLFARLLNLNEKNVTETIRNCDNRNNRRAEQNPYIYPNKVEKVNQLLDLVRFKK